MRKSAGWILVLGLIAANLVAAQEQGADTSAGNSGVTAASAAPPPPKGRLRFKTSGPVCMCGEGLGEQEIAQAQRSRFRQRKSELQEIDHRGEQSLIGTVDKGEQVNEEVRDK